MSSRVAIAALLLTACGSSSPAEQIPRPPNIVLILADDLGWGDLGCYAPDSLVPTPELDALASEGLRFSDAHSPSAVCSPTRYGILTGRYAWRTELERSVVWEWGRPLIEPDEVTLPELLREHGYRTACVGKWHLGWTWLGEDGEPVNSDVPFWPRNAPERKAAGELVDVGQPVLDGPTTHGFDSYFGDDVPNFPPRAWIEDERLITRASEPKPRGMFGSAGPTTPGWDLAAVMPRLADEAVEVIETHAAGERPLFLYVPLTAPHTPIAPSPAFAGTTRAGAYGDYVAEVDWVVGRILSALAAQGIANDTLVLFSSDNGSPARDGEQMNGAQGSVTERYGHVPNGPWRGLKADAWEAGHRVPLLVRWPGRVPEGATSDALVGLHDLYATLSEALDLESPAGAAPDSASFLQVLEDPGAPARDSLVHHSLDGTFAIRRGPWKLIPGNLGSGGFSKPSRVVPSGDDPGGQLYHLGDDPRETTNLWEEQPELVAELEALLEGIRREPPPASESTD